MRKILVTTLILLACAALTAQTAMADTYRYINFNFNGQTYTIRYSVEGGHFERVNAPAEQFEGGSMTYTAAYSAYLDAEDAAQRRFLQAYMSGDLGDSSVPMELLFAGAAGSCALALLAHWKRRSCLE